MGPSSQALDWGKPRNNCNWHKRAVSRLITLGMFEAKQEGVIAERGETASVQLSSADHARRAVAPTLNAEQQTAANAVRRDVDAGRFAVHLLPKEGGHPLMMHALVLIGFERKTKPAVPAFPQFMNGQQHRVVTITRDAVEFGPGQRIANRDR